jgi:hypothetical protein
MEFLEIMDYYQSIYACYLRLACYLCIMSVKISLNCYTRLTQSITFIQNIRQLSQPHFQPFPLKPLPHTKRHPISHFSNSLQTISSKFAFNSQNLINFPRRLLQISETFSPHRLSNRRRKINLRKIQIHSDVYERFNQR